MARVLGRSFLPVETGGYEGTKSAFADCDDGIRANGRLPRPPRARLRAIRSRPAPRSVVREGGLRVVVAATSVSREPRPRRLVDLDRPPRGGRPAHPPHRLVRRVAHP